MIVYRCFMTREYTIEYWDDVVFYVKILRHEVGEITALYLENTLYNAFIRARTEIQRIVEP